LFIKSYIHNYYWKTNCLSASERLKNGGAILNFAGMIEDSYQHKGLRHKLVKKLGKKGISNKTVLDAIGKVPRHLFMDQAFLKFAYEDNAFPIDEGQTISQPYTVAYQTQLLNPQYDDQVLEIGTGSGYQACVLAKICRKVYSIERFHKLYIKSKNALKNLGYKNIKTFHGDGYQGLPAFAPYDKILVTAAATYVPHALKEQLKIGGCLVIPVGSDSGQVMHRITKREADDYLDEAFDAFKFVPFQHGKVM